MLAKQGALVAFEGLDQSGKQTQSELLRDRLVGEGREVQFLSFPEYDTRIGDEIGQALAGNRHYPPDVMQLLYVANRYERKPDIAKALDEGKVLVCDRYLASSVAYGQAFGLDGHWLLDVQKYLPAPTLTVLLDIAPATAVTRKSADRDRYERDLALQTRVRGHYQELAKTLPNWLVLDGERPKDQIAADVFIAVRLALARQ